MKKILKAYLRSTWCSEELTNNDAGIALLIISHIFSIALLFGPLAHWFVTGDPIIVLSLYGTIAAYLLLTLLIGWFSEKVFPKIKEWANSEDK